MSVADPVVCESTVAMHDEPTIAHSATDLPIAPFRIERFTDAAPASDPSLKEQEE